MKGYTVSALAENDLLDIRQYIGSRNPEAAKQLLRKFADKFLLLAQTPGIGKRREELRPGLHCFPVDNYVIYFMLTGDNDAPIQITRVLHGARDERNLF